MSDRLKILCGDALEQLRLLETESVQCCVTSPPYWGLRDYGTASWSGGDSTCDHTMNFLQIDKQFASASTLVGSTTRQEHHGSTRGFKVTCPKCGAKRLDMQLGLEKTPEEYVDKMVEAFREVRRVLKNDGTLWLNLGDSYCHDTKWGGSSGNKNELQQGYARKQSRDRDSGCKPKDLVGIPWLVAFALRSDGWWLRQDIIWNKANCMPESVTDRCTKSHEYLFMLTKQARYYYDAEAIKEPASESDWESRIGRANLNNKLLSSEELNGIRPRVKYTPNGKDKQSGHGRKHGGFNARWDEKEWQGKNATQDENSAGRRIGLNTKTARDNGDDHDHTFGNGMRNKRDVWTVAPANFPEAHFATYPPDLIKPCILAGSKPGDTILDPFAGSGTTGMVALELGRKAILIELNPKYVELIEQRCNVTPGLHL